MNTPSADHTADATLDTDPRETLELERYHAALKLQAANPRLTLLQAWRSAANTTAAT
jgi:hypothetical protein